VSVKPYKVVEYGACPECDCWSLGIQANGRIVRHSIGRGSVERLSPGSCLTPAPICKGSGAKVRSRKESEHGTSI